MEEYKPFLSKLTFYAQISPFPYKFSAGILHTGFLYITLRNRSKKNCDYLQP